MKYRKDEEDKFTHQIFSGDQRYSSLFGPVKWAIRVLATAAAKRAAIIRRTLGWWPFRWRFFDDFTTLHRT